MWCHAPLASFTAAHEELGTVWAQCKGDAVCKYFREAKVSNHLKSHSYHLLAGVQSVSSGLLIIIMKFLGKIIKNCVVFPGYNSCRAAVVHKLPVQQK